MAENIKLGMKCIKLGVFLANFMFMVIGFLLTLIGFTIKAIYGDNKDFIGDYYYNPANLAIAIGIIICFVNVFGFIGALKESTCLINLFGFFLTVLLILEIAAAIAAYSMQGQIERTIRKKMERSYKGYYVNQYEREMWDSIQIRLGCCGIDTSSDWDMVPRSSSEFVSDASKIWSGPYSCCNNGGHHESNVCLASQVYHEGCVDALSNLVSESALLLGSGAVAVAFIQILGIIFAWLLARAVRRLKTMKLVEKELERQRNYAQRACSTDGNPAPVILYTPTDSEA